MTNFKFHSKIRKEYSNQLENLFFFNERQSRYYNKIIELVEKYGEPNIAKYGDYIIIELEKVGTECLFASYGPKLVGVMVYKINKFSKSISVIHIAIEDNYTMRGKYAKKDLVNKMLEKLKEIARKIYRLGELNIFYGK